MSKYASLLFAPENYHHIGPFRFPIFHDLVPGEAKGIEDLSRQQAASTFRSVKLAQKIAKDKGITVKASLELLSSQTEESQDILLDYVSEFEELQRNSVGATQQQIAFVTLFMKFRGEAILPPNKKWVKLDQWDTDDTEAMPSKLMNEIFSLITWERDGWPNEDATSEKLEVKSQPLSSS